MELIFPIFEDVTNPEEEDKFPTLPYPDNPSRGNRKEYRRRLEEVDRHCTVTFRMDANSGVGWSHETV